MIRAQRTPRTERRAILLLAAAALAFASAATASRRSLDAGEEDSIPRVAATILSLDFDPRPGATVIGITSSAPLTNHTVYEADASTIVLEIPDADVARLEPVATLGTPQVSKVSVQAIQRGPGTIARFEISRAQGARRTVALDPRNPKRLEITVESAAAAAPAPEMAAAPAAAPAKVLASAPAKAPTSAAGEATHVAPSRRAEASIASATRAEKPQPAPDRTEPAAEPARFETPGPATTQAAAPIPVMTVASADPASIAMEPPTPRPVPQSVLRESQPSRPAPEAAAPRGPCKLTDVTVEPGPDGRTLVRLTGTRAIEARPFELDDKPRLVLDLVNTVNALPFANQHVRDSAVLTVRASQNEPMPKPVTRVVLDLSGHQPYELIPGPDSLMVAVGSRTSMAPMASNGGWQASPIGQGALVSGPSGAAFANLGRPSTATGMAPPPLPAVDPADGRPAMRETADATQVGSTTVSASQRYEEVKVTGAGRVFTGEPISISVKDADLQDLFRLFHSVSGLNIAVDPSVKGKTITLELVDVPWDQALDLVLRTQGLGQSLEGNVLRIAPTTKLAQEEQQLKQLQEAQELSGEVVSVAFPLSYANGAAVETIVRKGLSQRGDIARDTRTNTLIIKDLPGRIEAIRALLQLLDQPTKQVMIEARIIETTLDFSKSVGIRWGLSYIADRAFGNSTGFSFPRSIATDYAVNLPVQAASSVLGLSFRNIFNTFALDLQISALEDRGKARIISRPMVMVQNNESAEIESGVQIPITNTTATETDVTFVSASLRLTVQPQITADNTVIMSLRVENNAPVFIQTVGDNASISTRQARTVVAVPDGGTTVIGGIYQVNEGAASTRVPFLSRIPLLGWLFRNKTIDRTNDELLIFITPRIQKA